MCIAGFLTELKGGRIENTTTSKGLMHSNDRIKETWATIEGGAPTLLLWGITGTDKETALYGREYKQTKNKGHTRNDNVGLNVYTNAHATQTVISVHILVLG